MEVKPLPETVVCRPDKSFWLIAVIFGGMGLSGLWSATLPPHRWEDTLAGIVGGLVFLIPSVWLALLLLRARVIADEQGLRWRMVGRWRSCHWDEITDYYEVLSSEKQSQKRLVVETQQVRLNLGPLLWEKGSLVLRRPIRQNAMQAKAQTWELMGTRQHDKWPQVFQYNTLVNRWVPWLGLIYFGGLMAVATISVWRKFVHAPDWGWEILGFAMCLLLVAPVLWMQMYAIASRRPRFSQRIIVSLEGLVFVHDNHAKLKIAWADVTAYQAVCHKQWGFTEKAYSVMTFNSAFEFTWHITEETLLRKIITRYAVNAANSDWESHDINILGGVALRWSGGQEGVGARIFHYRTRHFRAGAVGLTIIILMVLLVLIFGGFEVRPGSSILPVYLTMLGLLPYCVVFWMIYYCARIEVDDVGITQRSLFGKKHSILWPEVQSIDNESRFFVRGVDQSIGFSQYIADLEELKAEIARRALNSRNRTWDEAETSKEPNSVKGQ